MRDYSDGDLRTNLFPEELLSPPVICPDGLTREQEDELLNQEQAKWQASVDAKYSKEEQARMIQEHRNR